MLLCGLMAKSLMLGAKDEGEAPNAKPTSKVRLGLRSCMVRRINRKLLRVELDASPVNSLPERPRVRFSAAFESGWGKSRLSS